MYHPVNFFLDRRITVHFGATLVDKKSDRSNYLRGARSNNYAGLVALQLVRCRCCGRVEGWHREGFCYCNCLFRMLGTELKGGKLPYLNMCIYRYMYICIYR